MQLKEPLEFPCKANCEKINVTIDGLKEKERLDGGPDYLPLPDEEEHGDDGDGGDDQDGDDGDGPGGGGGRSVDPSILREMEKMEREGAEDVARRAELPPPPGLEGVHAESERKDKIYVEVLEHYSEGERGDGKIYLNDDGERVKRLTEVDEHTVLMTEVSESSTILQDPTSSLLMKGDEFHMGNVKRSSKLKKWNRMLPSRRGSWKRK